MNITATQNPAYDKMVEKAITYLVRTFVSTGHNPKPVILHSIRTGLYLYHQNYSQDVVVAAILHDLIEDTNIKVEDIEMEFGSEVAQLVTANSFNTAIRQRDERDIDMLNRCKEAGKWALLIKAADILDNSDYFRLSADEEQSHWLLRKMAYFLELSSELLSQEPVWQCLKQRYQDLVQSSGIKP
jgi:(p)ppGpp synthase/HD superfamily hydrolase